MPRPWTSDSKTCILRYTSFCEGSEPQTPPSFEYLVHDLRRTVASGRSQKAGRHPAGSLKVLTKMPLDILYEVRRSIICSSKSCQCHDFIPIPDMWLSSPPRCSTLSSDIAKTSGSANEPFVAVGLEICVFHCARPAPLPIGSNIAPIRQPRF
jgi:hypothetical protein